jgi:hypothetical protein
MVMLDSKSKVRLALFLALTLSMPASGQKRGEMSVDPNASMLLTKVQLASAQASAISGDRVAMRKVLDHYGLAVGDLERTDAWMRVAAIQGGQDEMINHAAHLRNVGTDQACIEALAWLERVRESPSTQSRKHRADRLFQRIAFPPDANQPCAAWYASVMQGVSKYPR